MTNYPPHPDDPSYSTKIKWHEDGILEDKEDFEDYTGENDDEPLNDTDD